MWRQTAVLAWTSCLLAVAMTVGGTDVETSSPNFIFMMADDYGWGDVGYNGGNASTPNLDAMAKGPNSLKLQRYYSGGPVCSPTRGTVLTGRNHNRYCVWTANAGGGTADFVRQEKMPLPYYEYTIPEAVKSRGYTSAMFGKWHLGDFKVLKGGNPKWPISHPGIHGFDIWHATERSAPTATTNCGCFSPPNCISGHWNQNFSCTNFWTANPSNSSNIMNLTTPEPGDDSLFIMDMVEPFLRGIAQDKKPFFLYIPVHTVHINYIAVEPYRSKYQKLGYDSQTVDYLGAIEAMDVQVGRLRSLLQELNLANNTLLWFASDNGPAKGTPGSTNGLRGRKGTVYEGGVRVPGIIEWPNVISENRVVDAPIVSSDLMPTIMDILKLEMPDNRTVDGESIMNIITGNEVNRSKPIGFMFSVKHQFNSSYNATWVNNQYKLFMNMKNGVPHNAILYDLLDDIAERKDVSKKHPDVFSAMKDQFKTWFDSVQYSTKHESGCYGISVADGESEAWYEWY
ncbi:steryl-sulfatase-like [Sycon ciliatum]|uniref:steryl-sulfatase-like n=1 Tax=Sycon ciliatum TaxID=27933 RepID=UPI0020AB2E93|eukprot:scpid58461/ scgid26164/ N-acetylgalactosamine-6-sulfatase; Chondroitinsulfatase; Galactose-6-sulfate sulfatase; N-acetylgalactosamine-6-sulfate sulfatase